MSCIPEEHNDNRGLSQTDNKNTQNSAMIDLNAIKKPARRTGFLQLRNRMQSFGYRLNNSSCSKAANSGIPGSRASPVTGVTERSQSIGTLKYDGDNYFLPSTHLPSTKNAVQPVALPSFSEDTYCCLVLRLKRTIDLLPSGSATGASAR